MYFIDFQRIPPSFPTKISTLIRWLPDDVEDPRRTAAETLLRRMREEDGLSMTGALAVPNGGVEGWRISEKMVPSGSL